MPRFSLHLLHPRYWLTWLGVGLWWLVVQLPFAWQMALARRLGPLACKLIKGRRHIIERNIQLCFPELSASEQSAQIEANMTSTIMAFFETGAAWFWPKKRLQKRFTIEGLEHLDAVKNEGQGVLLLAMHFTNLDLGAKLLSLEHSIDGLYRPHKNPVYDYVQRKGREKHQEGRAIARDDVRQMVRRLRQGHTVWFAPDQNYSRQHHVFVPFFGVQAATVTSTAQLARMGKAKVIPFTHFRQDGNRYHVKIYPPLEDFPEGDEHKDAQRVNQKIESYIRQCPEQYLWVHRRFKTRPPGEPSVY